MSNSVNNLKNCVFCLFILCFLSSCIVEEIHEINEATGLEWTFKKYRNGDESITVGNQTIRGKDVDYFYSGENLFKIISDSAYIYYASESMLLQITAIPKHGLLHPILTFSREIGDSGNRLFCSSNGDFWIQNEYEDNDGYWYADLYNRNGNYIATVSKCLGVKCKNPYWDYVDYYKVHNEFGERNRHTKVGVYDVKGNLVVPIVYHNVGEIYWSFDEEVANLYTFIAQKGTLKGEDFFDKIQSYDVISYSGELLLSLDLSKRRYFANGKQNVLDNWRIEYDSDSDSDSAISWYEEDSVWAALERGTFKGYNVYPLDTDEFYDSYFITKIDNAFYLLHRYEGEHYNDIIESAKIPLASKTISSSSANTKSALDMVRDVLMTDITDSFFEDPKSYFIQKATIGKIINTYEKGESFLIIGDNRMTTQWADGSGCTNKMAPKNITIYDHLDGEEKTALAYALDDGLAVRAISSGGTRYILLYTYNKSMKSYVQMASYSLYN